MMPKKISAVLNNPCSLVVEVSKAGKKRPVIGQNTFGRKKSHLLIFMLTQDIFNNGKYI